MYNCLLSYEIVLERGPLRRVIFGGEDYRILLVRYAKSSRQKSIIHGIIVPRNQKGLYQPQIKKRIAYPYQIGPERAYPTFTRSSKVTANLPPPRNWPLPKAAVDRSASGPQNIVTSIARRLPSLPPHLKNITSHPTTTNLLS